MLTLPALAAVTLSLSDGSSADVRYVPEAGGTALDLSTAPAANLAFTTKASSFDVSYSVRLARFDVTRTNDFGTQHLAGVGYSWGRRRLQLRLTLSGTYGEVLFYNAIVAPPAIAPVTTDGGTPQTPTTPPMMQPRPQLVPQASVLTIVGLGAALAVNYRFSRHWSGFMGLGFGVGGGIHGSETNLPFHYGPSAGAGATYKLTQLDSLGSSLTGAVDFAPKTHGKFETITLLETYTHGFSPLTLGSIGAGASYVQIRPSQHASRTRTVNAAGIASLSHTFKLEGGAQMTAAAGASLLSNYDPVLGTVTQGLGANAGLGWSRKKLTMTAGAQTGHSLPFSDPNAFVTYGATAGASYQLFTPVQLRVGGFWSHQVLPAASTLANPIPDRWGASLGITLVAPPIVL